MEDNSDSASGFQINLDKLPQPEPTSTKQDEDVFTYEKEVYEQYLVLIDEIVSTERFLRRHTKSPLKQDYLDPILQFLRKPTRCVPYEYKTLKKAVKEGPDRTLAPVLEEELRLQYETFRSVTGMNEAQAEKAIGALRQVGNLCAKRARATALDVAWEKVKESGLKLDEVTLNTFLYGCTTYSSNRRYRRTLGSPMSSILDFLDPNNKLKDAAGDEEGDEGAKDEKKTGVDDEEKKNGDDDEVDVPNEIATMHDILYDASDQSISVRVKALVAQGDAQGAESLVNKVRNQKLDRSVLCCL